ncbi:MAG: hypothetical protein ACPG6V_03685 [Flavobacteriales bacterium]
MKKKLIILSIVLFQFLIFGQSHDFGLNINSLNNSTIEHVDSAYIPHFDNEISNKVELSLFHRIHLKNKTFIGYEVFYHSYISERDALEDNGKNEVESYRKINQYGINLLYGKTMWSSKNAQINIVGLVGYRNYPKYTSRLDDVYLENTDVGDPYLNTVISRYPQRQQMYLGIRLNLNYEIYKNLFFNFSIDNYFRHYKEKGLLHKTYEWFTIDKVLLSKIESKANRNRTAYNLRFLGPSMGIFLRL